MVLRDNASNGVKACNDWGVSHFGCVAHCLHLIVGPFLLCSKKEDDEGTEIATAALANEPGVLAAAAAASANQLAAEAVPGNTDEGEEREDIGGYVEELADQVKNVKLCRMTVQKIRTEIKFCRKSAKAMAKLAELLAEFGRTSLPILTQAEWAIAHGLVILLKPFFDATENLSGNSYPSFALAVPLLLKTLRNLKKPDLFREWDYAGDDCSELLIVLQSCRRWLLEKSEERLQRMVFFDGKMYWISYMDPRFRDGNVMKSSVNDAKKQEIIQQIKDEAFQLAVDEEHPEPSATLSQATTIESASVGLINSTPRKKRKKWIFDSPSVVDGNIGSKPVQEVSREEKLKAEIAAEVEFYMKPVVNPHDIDPLVWWREHQKDFPHLSRVARKWLGVCATSTESERVFSSCGVALTAKRAKLKGSTLEAQVKLKYNLPACGMDIEDIAQAL
ncbi:hypothetical protein FisN_2Lu388 [Fistulifera solaris]|uniref:HAT C-terminal dimerisation domain-containing protein n=1 Tax=Fistulifera solaris TaxID=1519565 RepID=A0A1Z5JQ48_FISSO|nr:hypothetical protein FisN_2Lu388 [Fistulifera solaris]|eukprot:GAX15901.1 hypothetical protein FisN_2Lu388 [Fistulifera solaris]